MIEKINWEGKERKSWWSEMRRETNKGLKTIMRDYVKEKKEKKTG